MHDAALAAEPGPSGACRHDPAMVDHPDHRTGLANPERQSAVR
jgi:hypothetical protein